MLPWFPLSGGLGSFGIVCFVFPGWGRSFVLFDSIYGSLGFLFPLSLRFLSTVLPSLS